MKVWCKKVKLLLSTFVLTVYKINNPITRKIEILIDTDIDYLEGVAHNIVTCVAS